MFRRRSTELSRCFGIIFVGERWANGSFSLVPCVFVVVTVLIIVFSLTVTACANLSSGFLSSKLSKAAFHWFLNQALTSLVLVKGSSSRLPGYLSPSLPLWRCPWETGRTPYHSLSPRRLASRILSWLAFDFTTPGLCWRGRLFLQFWNVEQYSQVNNLSPDKTAKYVFENTEEKGVYTSLWWELRGCVVIV